MKICLLGASFDTGNLGVSALAESSVKIILSRWPDAEITLQGNGSARGWQYLSLMGREIRIGTSPIRFSKNIFLQCHFLRFVLCGILTKVLPVRCLKKTLVSRNPYFKTLYEADIVASIDGGDSFSDIYGYKRFFWMFLRKWLVIFLGKKLILLPQTYGPFENRVVRTMAKYILKHATAIYARDCAGVEYVKHLLNNTDAEASFLPDVAFVLDSKKPENIDIGGLAEVKTEDTVVVGLNISGLLFNGGYTQDNMFGLKSDYRELVYSLIDFLMKSKKILVLLVPHVFASEGDVESDPEACRQVHERIRAKYSDRIFLTQGVYDQGEIKYLIGKCDFFIGSRMHSCIAALSQGIPAVGIAYSKKFYGVFESIGLADCVADARTSTEDELIERVNLVFEERLSIRKRLRDTIPAIQHKVLDMFKASEL